MMGEKREHIFSQESNETISYVIETPFTLHPLDAKWGKKFFKTIDSLLRMDMMIDKLDHSFWIVYHRFAGGWLESSYGIVYFSYLAIVILLKQQTERVSSIK